MKIIFLCFGKIKPNDLSKVESLYLRRLKKYNTELIELKKNNIKKNYKEVKFLQEKQILKILKKDDFIILLDEKGKLINNNDIMSLLNSFKLNENNLHSYKRLLFIIGGAYGVTDIIKNKADITWSLSKMVLAGGISRIVLFEAIYRSMMILENHPYHND